MELENKYLDEESVSKLLDVVILSIKSTIDKNINSISVYIKDDSSDIEKIETDFIRLGNDYKSGKFKVSIDLTKKWFFWNKKVIYQIKLEYLIKRNEYLIIEDSTIINTKNNQDKIKIIFDLLYNIQEEKKRIYNNSEIKDIIEGIGLTIDPIYKRDDKLNKLLNRDE